MSTAAADWGAGDSGGDGPEIFPANAGYPSPCDRKDTAVPEAKMKANGLD